MRITLVLFICMFVNTGFAAKKRDMFGSKLKSAMTEQDIAYSSRSLAKSAASKTVSELKSFAIFSISAILISKMLICYCFDFCEIVLKTWDAGSTDNLSIFEAGA